jgi:hypothetical protein
LLGAALLTRLSAYAQADDFAHAALAATRYSLSYQRADGSWPYGEACNQKWIDSFHTGYNLLALLRVRGLATPPDLSDAISRGYRYYLDNFFEKDGRAKYFHDRIFPIDTHSIAQALITLTELEQYDQRSRVVADAVLKWALENMRDPEGWFYYQKWGTWTNRICYMRWCQAWMLLALAHFAGQLESRSLGN